LLIDDEAIAELSEIINQYDKEPKRIATADPNPFKTI